MKFKVGDKVRCIDNKDREDRLTIGEEYNVSRAYEGAVELNGKAFAFWDNRFELVEQSEPQVDDVWGSEDKSRVVRIVAKFERNDITWISFLEIKGEYKGVANYIPKGFFIDFHPLLLHRPPKKQPKPKVEPPKKQEEVWERIFHFNDDYRCGNKIKVIYRGCEGFATCNKKDKFDLMFGVNLASHRAMVKYHQKVIAEMIKEGAK